MKKRLISYCFLVFILCAGCLLCTSESNFLAANKSKVEYYNGHRYQVFNDCMKWKDAKAACEEKGGHLVTINSKKEQKFVDTILKEQSLKVYWIGLYKSGMDKKWVTDEAVSYNNIEMENNGQNFFGIYSGVADFAGKWYDHDDIIRNDMWDYTKTGYICEWETTPLKNTNISLSKDSYYYDGSAKKPTVKVSLAGKTLKKNKDYTIQYSKNKNVGTAKVVIKGKGSYTGTVTKKFKILKTSIKLNASKITLNKGNTFEIVATVKGNSKKVKWTSSDTAVVSVNDKGVVTAKKKGTVTITATANGKTAKCRITVK